MTGNTDFRNLTREDFLHFQRIPTRWMDNDIYGHVNNVVYYSWFDTLINRFLIEQGGLDIHDGEVVGFAVESHCNYYSPLAYPETVTAGLRIGHLGKSSARYEIGLFAEQAENVAAYGHFVHVFVDRNSRVPSVIPEKIRLALERLSS